MSKHHARHTAAALAAAATAVAGTATAAAASTAPAPAAATSAVSPVAVPKDVLQAGGQHTVQVAAAPDPEVTVAPGNTLSGIALAHCGAASRWRQVYTLNRGEIRDPNLIYAGQEFRLPKLACKAAATFVAAAIAPRSSRSARTDGDGDTDNDRGDASSGGSGSTSPARQAPVRVTVTGLSGTLNCAGLERLWENAGGNPGSAFMAAEIAMAESGGQQYALSPADDRGYWQINWSNGALSTFDAYGNARAAVIISGNGSNWSPWVTYQTGAYAGRC